MRPSARALPSNVTWPDTFALPAPHPATRSRTLAASSLRMMSLIAEHLVAAAAAHGLPGELRDAAAHEADAAVAHAGVDAARVAAARDHVGVVHRLRAA